MEIYIVVNISDMLNENLKVITDHTFDKANVVPCKIFVHKFTKKNLEPTDVLVSQTWREQLLRSI